MRVCTSLINKGLCFVEEVVVVVGIEVEIEYGNRKRRYREEDPVHQACKQQSSHRTQILPQRENTVVGIVGENTKSIRRIVVHRVCCKVVMVNKRKNHCQ